MLAVDLIIDEFTDRQNGVVAHEQLLARGVDRHTIKLRRDSGRLIVLFRGVYGVGGVSLPHLARRTAAVLACAPRAALSHAAALATWDVAELPPHGLIDITVVGRQCAQHEGIRIHRVSSLDACDITHHRGLPLTTPARALLEHAADAMAREVERALDEAIAQRLLTRPDVLSVIDRYPHARGVVLLRALADPGRASQITQREAEERLHELLRRVGAPPSETQVWIGRWKADRLWRAQRVVVEVDGGQFHRDVKRFERDHRKDADLLAAGYVVLRFTARQVMYEPEYVMFRIGQALSRAGLPTAAPAA